MIKNIYDESIVVWISAEESQLWRNQYRIGFPNFKNLVEKILEEITKVSEEIISEYIPIWLSVYCNYLTRVSVSPTIFFQHTGDNYHSFIFNHNYKEDLSEMVTDKA